MGSSNAQEAPSPTASFIFLPVGRPSRRSSKSSLSNAVDRDTLNEALDNIHNAAYNSQSLTVFNEYTKPPPTSSDNGAKGTAGESQGGISGFYNKLVASVAGSRPDSSDHGRGSDTFAVTSKIPTQDTSIEQNGTPGKDNVASPQPAWTEECRKVQEPGKTSRVQSPAGESFARGAKETSSKPSKSSSQTPSITSKASLPSTPALASPTFSPQKLTNGTIEPSLSDLSTAARRGLPMHSRNMSDQGHRRQDSLENADEEVSSHEKGLRKVNTTTAIEAPTGLERAPQHLRDIQSDVQVSLAATLVAQNSRPGASSDNISKSATDSSKAKSGSGQPKLRGEAPAVSGVVTSPSLRSGARHGPRVSQSRLPGFGPSRASSSESLHTYRRTEHIKFSDVALDGLHDRLRPKSLQPRPSSTKFRSKLLSKEFWMRDENARDCFHCGEPFSTFRRKHHCRTCGQIFDNKCTVLIRGAQFGSIGSVRVCKPCEALFTAHQQDSSEESGEEVNLEPEIVESRTPVFQYDIKLASGQDDDSASIISQSLEQMSKTPTMSFPVRRAIDGKSRSSAVLEYDATDHPLPRPSSSRSLRGSHTIGHGHKRHHSRHQHVRNFKAYHEERAPFQRKATEDLLSEPKRSNFHRDSIIDPDLAQYLSDDTSSDDDQSDVFNMAEANISKAVPDSERTHFGGLLAAVRKGRSRFGEKSISNLLNIGRDSDEISITSSRQPQRGPRQRNLSIASNFHARMSSTPNKENVAEPALGESDFLEISIPGNPTRRSGASKMTRSASMRGVGAPALELNRASLQHVKKLLQQLLRDANVPRASNWESALIPVLLRATDDVDPDVQRGDDIDIRHYVKLKKVPGGRPSDTSYISGLVFTKNLALKSMPRSILQPRILIITFPLEYARHEQHFMSLAPVISQEKEYLQNLVGRIAALNPTLLLSQRNVSGLALQFLEKANIATAYNAKPAVLEAVSRCTGTRIIHTMDKLAIQPAQIGTCDSFEVKTFVFEGRKKTYIYLSGCIPQLGCTIALRGADESVLSKVKRITEFMIYVVYNLKLETCLMRDEFALIPSGTEGQPRSPRLTLERPGTLDKLAAAISSDTVENTEGGLQNTANGNHARRIEPSQDMSEAMRIDSAGSGHIPDEIPVPKLYEDLVEKLQTKILSASPFVKFMQPYLLMRARELERRVAYLKGLRDQDVSAEAAVEETAQPQKFTLIQPEMVHASLSGTSSKVREILHAVHDSEYDKALHNYETQKKQWEAFISGSKNLFDPYAHQNIVVLFSLVSTATSVPCSGPDLLAFSFYNEHESEEGFEADCTLGQFVEDLCYRANDVCPANGCERMLFEHHRQYVHGQAQVSVFVVPHSPKMRGMQDTILMWSQCKICGNETPVLPMSASTWKYSFGKYLELSFWSSDLHARAGICPHDLHRDHLRYFGYKNFALRFHYDPISLLEIIVPRLRITWKVDNDLKFRNEVYTKIEQRLNKFMGSVKSRLKDINPEAVVPEKVEACRAEVELLTNRANEEHLSLLKQLQDSYSNSKHWETIPLNRAVRATQEVVAEWDTVFAKFEQDFFPSEKDIRRLATIQLTKTFLGKDVSVTSVTSNEEGPGTPPSESASNEKIPDPDATPRPPGTRGMTRPSPEKTQNLLQSVLEEHSKPESDSLGTSQASLSQTESQQLPKIGDVNVRSQSETIEPLDLAIPIVATDANGVHPEDGTATQTPVSKSSLAGMPNRSEMPSIPTSPSHAGTEPDEPSAGPGNTTKGLQSEKPGLQPTLAAGIPIPVQSRPSSIPLLRAHSQPPGLASIRREHSTGAGGALSALHSTPGFGFQSVKPSEVQTESNSVIPDKKLSERLGLNRLKGSKLVKGHSLIPRSLSSKKDSRVSALAKHFEQLSREFEKERVRERKQRAAQSRHSRVYPLASSKPLVEVYQSVDDAVQEKDTSDESFHSQDRVDERDAEAVDTLQCMAETEPSPTRGDSFHADDTGAELTETDVEGHDTSRAQSDVEGDDHSDDEQVHDNLQLLESQEDLAKLTTEDLDLKELPKHEQSSLMKMLTNFWAERSSSGWTALDYPLGATDHIFADCDIIVREDEPSSIIAFALDSDDYKSKLHEIQHEHYPQSSPDSAEAPSQSEVMHSLLRKTGIHLKYQIQEGPTRALCKIFFAEQFDAMRKRCGISDRIVESLSRCMKWDSKGGKTKSLFLKTLDDRFVLKSLSPIETQAFLKFAPNYFQIMSEAFFHELPSVIAKMLGFYQIVVKSPATGVEYNWFLLVMENLFYERSGLTRIFDLKGSMRNRKIEATGERNEVLLDENMVEFIYESPLFAREHSKKLLRSSVHNDTLFLARQNVMDYSLMMAIDGARAELVVGIIDCIRTYTWDKKLESWIKDRSGGLGLGGMVGAKGQAKPTVTSPKEYKKRFREAMGRYVLEAPSCWHQFRPQGVEKGSRERMIMIIGPPAAAAVAAENQAAGASAAGAGAGAGASGAENAPDEGDGDCAA